MYTLGKLASLLGGVAHGDQELKVKKLATLSRASSGDLSFLSNPKYLSELKTTKATAVLLSKEALEYCPVDAIVLDNPYLAFAKVAELFDTSPKPSKTIHPSAVVDSTAFIGEGVSVGPNAMIGKDVKLMNNVVIGANSVVEAHSVIGENSEIKSNVSVYHNVKVGKNCIIHANTVIGSDGFGNAKDEHGKWIKIPQLGGVVIGDNVEIGASTTIDRGAIDDTVIADGVRIDNQIQIAHNVTIGENTAIAGSTGIAGSVDIGKTALLVGRSGLADIYLFVIMWRLVPPLMSVKALRCQGSIQLDLMHGLIWNGSVCMQGCSAWISLKSESSI